MVQGGAVKEPQAKGVGKSESLGLKPTPPTGQGATSGTPWLAPAGGTGRAAGQPMLGSHKRTKGPICSPEVSLISRMNMFSFLRSSC